MLKKFTMILIANLLLLTILQGQSIGFEFGGGVRTLLINGQINNFFDAPALPSLSAGVNALIPLGSNKLQIMPALRYVMKGGDLKLEQNVGNTDEIQNYRLNYFEVAPQILFRFNEDYKGFFLNAGPILDFGIGGKCYICRNNSPEFGSSGADDFAPTNIGVTLGGGLIRTNEETSRTFFMNLNVGIGFGDVRTNAQKSQLVSRPNGDIANRWIEGSMANFYIGLNFGYLFPLFTH